MTTHPGDRNPNWKGGRTIDPRGYVLVKRRDHPAADSRGYVYEHRLIAEATLGRLLADGEEVHHTNEDKSDNRPENLEVLTHAEHARRHRQSRRNLRDPGEPNETISCACGCGSTFDKYDPEGRPRRFVSGHNGRKPR